MPIVKVSTPWNHIDFNTRIQNNENCRYKFDFSDACNVCDFWIIWGGIKKETEKVLCPPQNVIYLTDEVHEQRVFNSSFLKQFAAIITCRTDIQHGLVITSHELNTWLIQKDYNWLAENHVIPKTKIVSVVCSDHTWLPGHKIRFAFVNKLIGHFKDEIDVFGRGFNPIDDKYEALAPYKYSVAIENSALPGYFTEKIADCYLTNTVPLYYGCPDISSYFDPASFLQIDPNDFKNSIQKIERLMDEDPYEQMLPLLRLAKEKYLKEYHIFNKLPHILKKDFAVQSNKKMIEIRNEATFLKVPFVKKLLRKIIKKSPY